jgi:hypothetical protein
MTVTVWDPEADTDLDGIRYLLEQGNISGGQAAEMIRRVHSRTSLASRAARAITNSPGPAANPQPPRPGVQPLLPPVPIERLRQLSAEDRWQALLFLAGLVPAAVEKALAAILTPGSTAGIVR